MDERVNSLKCLLYKSFRLSSMAAISYRWFACRWSSFPVASVCYWSANNLLLSDISIAKLNSLISGTTTFYGFISCFYCYIRCVYVLRLLTTIVLQSLLPAGLREAQPCRYCFYSVVQKWATRCPDKREIWHGGEFHVYRGRNVGIQPPKLSKFRILAINLPLRGHSFAQFFTKFSDFIRVYSF